jgi:hypothetical protein
MFFPENAFSYTLTAIAFGNTVDEDAAVGDAFCSVLEGDEESRCEEEPVASLGTDTEVDAGEEDEEEEEFRCGNRRAHAASRSSAETRPVPVKNVPLAEGVVYIGNTTPRPASLENVQRECTYRVTTRIRPSQTKHALPISFVAFE